MLSTYAPNLTKTEAMAKNAVQPKPITKKPPVRITALFIFSFVKLLILLFVFG